MLRFMALCFATGLVLAFSEYSQEPPEFSPTYTVRYDETDLLSGQKTAQKFWHDETQNKSLLEHHGAYLLVGRPCPANSAGLLVAGYWVTEGKQREIKNRWNCWNQSLQIPPESIEYFFEIFRIQPLKSFKFVEKNIVHGEQADKWQFAITYDSIDCEFNTWVTNKELGGVQQTVPLRFEMKIYDHVTGIMFENLIRDYYDFNTSAIDPKIFTLVSKDLKKCAGVKPGPFDDGFTTGFGHRGDFELFTAKHGEQHATQDHHELELENIIRHLRYPAAFGHVGHVWRGGRGGPQRARRLAGRAEGRRPMLRGRTPSDGPKRSGAQPFPYSDAEVEALSKELPEQFDWRLYGAVTPVKELSTCCASYSFAAADAVAAALFLQSNRTRLLRLSEQAIIDCSWEANFGCHGYSDIQYTFEWMLKHGLPTDTDYGGYHVQNGYCNLANVKSAVTISGYVEVPSNNENALKLAILNHGPVTVAINDFYIFSENYNGGVYNNRSCDSGMYYCLAVGWGSLDGQKYWTLKTSTSHRWGVEGYALMAIDKNICGVMDNPVNDKNLKHTALVVGWGVLNGEKYWIIKNSWSTQWGVSGYLLIAIDDNMCGVMTAPFYVTI